MTAIEIFILLNTETVLMFVLVILTFHKYWETPKNMTPNTNKENMQDIDGNVSFGMKIDVSVMGIHIIVTPRYSFGLAKITGNSIVFSKDFFKENCPTAKDLLLT
jgi:hypothetical protein